MHLAIGLVVLAVLGVYANSLSGEFIFDDIGVIENNPTIRSLWPLGPALSPPPMITSTGRPLLNLSFAINYALGGTSVWGYHALNVAIHAANALLLFGILRHTFLLPVLREKFGDAALALSFAIALLWALHPLQTESVAYIAQRAESLVALFYLLTLYCVIRGAESGKPTVWYAGAVLACLLGMGAKEVMVTAPVVVLLYDRTFLAGSFRAALLRRWWLYTGMALTWMLLAYLIASTGELTRLYEGKGGAGNMPLADSGPWAYAATQPGAILHYLRLTLWPHPLVLDYGRPAMKSVAQMIPAALAIGMLLAGTLWGVIKRKPWGFMGAWFFLILSPTSSVVPLFDGFSGPIFEHRMYLPLAGVLAALVLAGYAGGRVAAGRGWIPETSLPTIGTGALALIATLSGGLTFDRNKDYASKVSIWKDTVEKAPDNPRAYANLGNALNETGKAAQAIGPLKHAVRMTPGYAHAHNDLGRALAATGLLQQAIEHYREAIRLKPDFAEPNNNMGTAFAELNRPDRAIHHFLEAIKLKADYAEPHSNLGLALAQMGRSEEAADQFRLALKLKPDFAEAHNNLGNSLAASGQVDKAVGHYLEALRLRPDFSEPHNNLGVVFFGKGDIKGAVFHFKEALRINPGLESARKNLERLAAMAKERR